MKGEVRNPSLNTSWPKRKEVQKKGLALNFSVEEDNHKKEEDG